MIRGEALRFKAKGGRLLFALLAVLLLGQAADAQTRFMYLTGQTVSPAFEGWWPNDDGSFTMFFGYMNSNWEQEFNILVGADNHFTFTEPGRLDDLERDAYDRSVADQGQPTHFYPRRNPFLFTVRVPRDFGTTELVWTLTTRGKVHRAYASLKTDYRIDPQVISTEVGGAFGSLSDALRYNIPPEIEIEGEQHRTVRVGERLALAVVANDPDDLPSRSERSRAPTNVDELYRPPSSVVASSGPGLRLSWIVYRGPAREVVFDPIQMKTWTDTRVYGNSPWSPPFLIPEPPPDGRWLAEATFQESGEYLLRVVASDGSMFSYENLPISVTR